MTTRAADQPDTRPGTPLMLTMETLDLWHQIIHDDSLERGDRLQRIAARINVIQDSVKRAADQVKGGRVCPNTLKLCACEKYAPCAYQVNADQPADAVVVPLDLIKRIDDALGAFTGDEELLNSHIDTYNDVREIRAAQEGK